MPVPCQTNISGSENECAKVEVKPSGQIVVTIKNRAYYPPGYVPSSSGSLNPSQLTTNEIKGVTTSVAASLDPNVLLCKNGWAVLAGKTDTALNFRDAVSGELKTDVLVAPAPNSSNPCDPLQPNRNGLHKTPGGLEVLTTGLPAGVDPSVATGAYTYVDCDTQETRVWIAPAPEVIGEDCAPIVDAKGNKIKRNAFMYSPNGYHVLTGRGDNETETYVDCASGELRAKVHLVPDVGCETDERKGKNALTKVDAGLQVSTGKNVKGGILTFKDCKTNELWGQILVKPEDTSVVCSPLTRKNAFRITDEGVTVSVGDTQTVDNYVDCDTQEIKSNVRIEETSKKVLAATDNGIQFRLSAKDINGNACPGLKIMDDGLAGFGPTCNLHGHDGESATSVVNANGQANNLRTLSKTVTNNTCKYMAGFILFRTPSYIAALSSGLELHGGFRGSYTVGPVTHTVGEEYFSPSNAGVYNQGNVMSASTGGITEFRQVTIPPGASVNIQLTPYANWVSSGNGGTQVGSYSIDVYMHNIDCLGPAS